MITIKTINNRNKKSFVDPLMENVTSLTKLASNGNMNSMFNILDNYDKLSYNEAVAVSKSVDILNKFSENANETQLKKVNRYLNETFLNIIKSKNYNSFLEELSDKYDKSLLSESIEDYRACDRILLNNKKLCDTSNFKKCIEESNLELGGSQDLLVSELCSIIDKYNMHESIKMNVALENIIYGIKNENLNINTNDAVLTIYEFFKVNGYNMDSFNTLLNENRLLCEEKDFILEFQNTKLDQILDSIANAKDFKTAKGITEKTKSLLKSMFATNPKQVLQELPNFFKVFRNLFYIVLLTNGPVGIIISAISFTTDFIISNNVNRKAMAGYIKQYEKEKEKLISSSKKKKLTAEQQKDVDKAVKALEEDIEKLKDYEDSLYTERENDKRKGYDESVSLTKGADKFLDDQTYVEPITVSEYLQFYHSDALLQYTKAVKAIFAVIKNRYKYMIEDNAIQIATDDDIKKFSLVNDKTICNYVGIDSDEYLNLRIATFLPLNLNNNDIEVRDFLDLLCDTVENILPKNYCVLFEGDSEMYTIYMVMNIPIECDCDDSVHESVYKVGKEIIELEQATNSTNTLGLLENICLKVSPDTLATLLEMVNNDLYIDRESYKNFLKETKTLLRNSDRDVNGFNKYMYIDTVNEAMYNINENNVNDIITESEYHIECDNILKDIDSSLKVSLNETSFINTIKMAKERISQKLKKASDKEKQLSRQIDNNLDKLNDGFQKMTIEKSREKIIKGNILPSASNVIKGSMAAGVTFLINPALAVVGLLGGLAVSKHVNKKQKQYILDEIDVNLQIVDKKIQMAESNNDMKSLEQLLKLQKKLKRERQRIFYNMKSYYNDINTRD